MMKSRIDILTSYNDAIRDLVNDKVQRHDKTFPQALKQLKLNSNNDWGFLCSSLDLIGDTALAIQNFSKFKVDGPTRYDDTGEKYLRLYGFLNAIYLQQSAVLKLYTIFTVLNPSKLDEKIKKLKITKIRHKVASHSINYQSNKKPQRKKTFVISRASLSGSKLSFINNSNLCFENADLLILLQDHLKLMISALDEIYEKAFKTIYQNNQDKIKEYSKTLKLLRQEKKGNLVIKSSGSESTLIFKVAKKRTPKKIK